MTIILIIIGLLIIIGVAILLITAPSTFRVERKITILASPEKIYPYISEFRKTSEWNPYEKMASQIERKYSGAESGVGAKYEWSSKSNKVGAGTQEIIHIEPNKLVRIRIEFLRPIAGVNQVEYKLTPKNDATEVSWSINGPMILISKIITLFISMDKMMGSTFSDGLADLKKIIEGK